MNLTSGTHTCHQIDKFSDYLFIIIYYGTFKICLFFNPLKTKCRLLYLKTQFVPRCKHFSSPL